MQSSAPWIPGSQSRRGDGSVGGPWNGSGPVAC
jgi:hypothetical protein